MNVFYSRIISRREFDTRRANGQPLQSWTPEAKSAFEKAGEPHGTVMVRHVSRVETIVGGDAIRDGGGSRVVFVEEIGIQ